jgi:hypothetical protein
MLTKGDFNNMSQEKQPDGSVLVTLTKRGDPLTYKLVVFDLYQSTEKIMKEEKVEAGK